MPKRNGIASTLALPCFRQRKVKPRKGKGSYTRKGRTKFRPFSIPAQEPVNLNKPYLTC